MADELSPMEVVEYYSRDDIAQEMVTSAQDREVGGRYRSGGFGKRPDVLMYPADVKAMARGGITSFHFSVERWRNPKMLRPGMAKKELDALRSGWDLLLDFDPKDFILGKIVAEKFIEVLKQLKLRNVSVKFSGNKGWHIAIPFESFSGIESYDGKPIQEHFPDAVRKICEYLMFEKVSPRTMDKSGTHIFQNDLVEQFEDRLTVEEYRVLSGAYIFKWDDVPGAGEEHLRRFLSNAPYNHLHLEQAPIHKNSAGSMITLQSASSWIKFRLSDDRRKASLETSDRRFAKLSVMDVGESVNIYADSDVAWTKDNHIDPFKIVDVDALLMTNRHMIRMPYSLHESSWLVSVPLPYERGVINLFDKEMARPHNMRVKETFLSGRSATNDALELFVRAYNWSAERHGREEEKLHALSQEALSRIPKDAIPVDHVPPCVGRALEGLEDGRKRMEFILEGFLRKSGWGWPQVEAQLLEWDARNTPPLGEGYIKRHIRYGMNRERDVLPPNCRNTTFYNESGLCRSDAICKGIKNPISYSRISLKRAKGKKKDGRERGKDNVRDDSEQGASGEEQQAPSGP